MTDLSLTDLATRTGVTPRTVRYYVAQGLLPSPIGQGGGAHYTDRHAARIRLIKRLQREHLPLAEIRNRLAVLGDAEVQRALDEADLADAVDTAAAAHAAGVGGVMPGGSALQYIRRVLDEGSTRGPGRAFRALRRAAPAAAPAPADLTTPAAPRSATRGVFEREFPEEYPMPGTSGRPTHDRLGSPSTPVSLPSPSLLPADRSTWERIGLTPDIELHVRRPLDRQTNRLLDRLLAYARELLDDRPR